MHLFRFRERLRHSGCRILEPVNVIAVRKVQSAEPRYSEEKKKNASAMTRYRSALKPRVNFQLQFQFEFALVTVYYDGVSR